MWALISNFSGQFVHIFISTGLKSRKFYLNLQQKCANQDKLIAPLPGIMADGGMASMPVTPNRNVRRNARGQIQAPRSNNLNGQRNLRKVTPNGMVQRVDGTSRTTVTKRRTTRQERNRWSTRQPFSRGLQMTASLCFCEQNDSFLQKDVRLLRFVSFLP